MDNSLSDIKTIERTVISIDVDSNPMLRNTEDCQIDMTDWMVLNIVDTAIVNNLGCLHLLLLTEFIDGLLGYFLPESIVFLFIIINELDFRYTLFNFRSQGILNLNRKRTESSQRMLTSIKGHVTIHKDFVLTYMNIRYMVITTQIIMQNQL